MTKTVSTNRQLAALAAPNNDCHHDITARHLKNEPNFAAFTALVHLTLTECRLMTTTPASLLGLETLRVLRVIDCPALVNVANLPGRLAELHVSACRALATLTAPDSLDTLFVRSSPLDHVCLGPNLIVLNLQNTELTDLTNVRAFTKLCVLYVSGCYRMISVPVYDMPKLVGFTIKNCPITTMGPDHFTKFTNVRRLDLSYCPKLTFIPESIGTLVKLYYMDLHGARALTRLPESIGMLQCLQTLVLNDCVKLTELPESLHQLSSLTRLGLTGCTSLQRLPKLIGYLPELRVLALGYCYRLTELPESLGHLSKLQSITLPGVMDRLPLSFCYLSTDIQITATFNIFTFPPNDIARRGMVAIRPFLLARHGPLKILIMILSARRLRMRHLPAELWVLILEEYAIRSIL